MRTFSLIFVLALSLSLSAWAASAPLASAPVRVDAGGRAFVAEAVVEAVRQSTLSAQVSGRITQLSVKAGDRVRKGQLLVRIDAQAAAQQVTASQAQVEEARAQLDVARKTLERQRQLFRQQYISQAALDQAEAQFTVTEAGVRGAIAQAGAATTQTGFYALAAPFDGVVAEVSSELGDMAMPGKSLLTVFDPAAMRAVATLPQSRLASLVDKAEVRVELPALAEPQRHQVASSVSVLPVADATTHTVQVRLGLPNGLAGLVPGMFARASFSLQGDGRRRLLVPAQAVVRRSELEAVYVLNQGRAQLRQVRLGKPVGNELEVLTGLDGSERVALDPIAASRIR